MATDRANSVPTATTGREATRLSDSGFTIVELIVVLLIIILLIGILQPTCGLPGPVSRSQVLLAIASVLVFIVIGFVQFLLKKRVGGAICLCFGVAIALFWGGRMADQSAGWRRSVFSSSGRWGAEWIRQNDVSPLLQSNRQFDIEEAHYTSWGIDVLTVVPEIARVDRSSLPRICPRGWKRVGDFIVCIEDVEADDGASVVAGYSIARASDGMRYIMFSNGKDRRLAPSQADVNNWNADRAALGLSPIPGLP